MLQDVYVGQNTNIDLTHCKDLLDTMSLDEAQYITTCQTKEDINFLDENNPPKSKTPTLEELEAINKHLENKGITKPKEKDKYLADYFNALSKRILDTDPELTNIILSYNNTLKYDDQIILTKQANSTYNVQVEDLHIRNIPNLPQNIHPEVSKFLSPKYQNNPVTIQKDTSR